MIVKNHINRELIFGMRIIMITQVFFWGRVGDILYPHIYFFYHLITVVQIHTNGAYNIHIKILVKFVGEGERLGIWTLKY